jgi:hypothetical protein
MELQVSTTILSNCRTLRRLIDHPGPPVAVVRNPGGRAREAIKGLAGLQAVLNPLTIVVMHHTGRYNGVDIYQMLISM